MENKELLVALLPKKSALEILQTEGWYHIPIENVPHRWEEGWRPKVMAFYQGKVFGKDDAYKIRHFGEVSQVDIVPEKNSSLMMKKINIRQKICIIVSD
ncbi:MAG: hypothetical protein L0287_20255 [Anaerolineae bacterium]|nr:hypothetical protein [Anaerolineae bacterium]MCI0608644.1 hypothetical protein [Anaerolineae bacterium]